MYSWFLIDSTTNQVTSAGSASHPPDSTALTPADQTFLGPYITLNATQQAVAANPSGYQYINGTFVALPYFTTTTSTTSGITTLTATLNNPPATPPPSATVTIGTSAISVPVTSETVTLPVSLHATLTGYSVPVQVSATGTVGATATVGSGGKPPVSVQAIAPTTSGDPYVIGPVGAGAKTFLRQVAMGLTPETEMEVLTLSAQNLAISAGVGLRVLVEKIIPWAQQTTWSALTLSAEENAALTALPTNLTAYLPGLGDLVTSTGTPAMPQLSEMYTQAPQIQTAMTNYATWLFELGL